MTANHGPDLPRRVQLVGLAGVVAFAIGGMVIGMRPTPQDVASTADEPWRNAPEHVVLAPAYLDMHATALYVAETDPHDLDALRPNPLEGSGVTPTEEAWRIGIADHLAHRAWDGAPPRIPHAIRDDGPLECLACHGEGLVVEGRIAPIPSHERMTNCTQCHVVTEQRFGGLPTEGALAHAQEVGGTNRFGGFVWPARGERAWIGAPPTIPHPTEMRTECASCHGATGHPGLRTSHPQRAACLQCHALDASIHANARTARSTPRGSR